MSKSTFKSFFDKAKPVFENPLSISQLNFSDRKLIEGPIFMCGDSAGLIHPLCGNGMSMAIQSAQLLSSLVNDYFSGTISSRTELEMIYRKAWNKEFRSRLRTGRLLARFFELNYMSNFILSCLSLA
ncbi:MAG: FAD-dependent oxidoreductase, partial [Flavobacteriaceae bacterium]|nr:FAD-dependent oxidoreductase [Flavobacteriaceae bacterium]